MSDTPLSNAKNVLSSDVEIKGSITFRGDLFFDGKMEGGITSPGNLSLGDNAVVNGDIKTRSVAVRGKVNGNITVGDRCELRGSAELIGDLKAARLVMEQEATLVGKSDVNPANASAEVSGGAEERPAAGGGGIRPLDLVKRAVTGR